MLNYFKKQKEKAIAAKQERQLNALLSKADIELAVLPMNSLNKQQLKALTNLLDLVTNGNYTGTCFIGHKCFKFNNGKLVK